MALLTKDERMLKNRLMEVKDMRGLWDELKYKQDEGHGYRKTTKEDRYVN